MDALDMMPSSEVTEQSEGGKYLNCKPRGLTTPPRPFQSLHRLDRLPSPTPQAEPRGARGAIPPSAWKEHRPRPAPPTTTPSHIRPSVTEGSGLPETVAHPMTDQMHCTHSHTRTIYWPWDGGPPKQKTNPTGRVVRSHIARTYPSHARAAGCILAGEPSNSSAMSFAAPALPLPHRPTHSFGILSPRFPAHSFPSPQIDDVDR